MKTSQQGRSLIREFEGFIPFAYPDPASPLGVGARRLGIRFGNKPARAIFASLPPDIQQSIGRLSGAPWTVGIGFTHGVSMDDHMTEAEADMRLVSELAQYESGVLSSCTLAPNQNQFDAMCCIAFNIGVGAFQKSTVLKAHNRGDFQSAARAFGLWNKAGGKVYSGLTRRRAAESALYLRPVPGMVQRMVEGAMPSAHADTIPEEPMPQSIDAESSLSASPINRAATIAGGTAALAPVVDALNTANSIKWGIEGLGQWIIPALAVTIVALVGYIIWTRWNQRRTGWA